MDRGDIIYEAVYDITPEDTAISLYAKAHHAGLILFETIVAHLGQRESFPHRRMNGTGNFYPRNSIAALREVRTSEEMERKSKAFYFPPFEPAYFRENERKTYVLPPMLLNTGFIPADMSLLDRLIDQTKDQFTCRIQ